MVLVTGRAGAAFNQKAILEVMLGRFDAAAASITRYRYLYPSSANALDTGWHVLAAAGRFEMAHRWLNQYESEYLVMRPRIFFRRLITKMVSLDTTRLEPMIDTRYVHWQLGQARDYEARIRLGLGPKC